MKLTEIGRETDQLDYMSVSMAVHRLGRRLQKDAPLRKALHDCRKQLEL